jgi:hypothetical protein
LRAQEVESRGEVGEQLGCAIGLHDLKRVGIEGEYPGFSMFAGGLLAAKRYDVLMPSMNPIETPDGHGYRRFACFDGG